MSDEIKSPYIPDTPVPFDYNKYQDDTTIKAAKEIFECIGRNASLLVFNHDVDNSVIVENSSKVAGEMMNIIIDCKVPHSDMSKLSDIMVNAVYTLFTIISRQQSEFEKELLARSIGIRDPGTNKYSREFASLGDMFATLLKIRETQGNNVEDYYTLTKKEPESPESK